jgi:hypothetical protein
MPRWLPVFVAVLLVPTFALTASDSERAEALGLVFTSAPPLRQAAYSGVLGDCYAHNDVAERWDGADTLAHEATHGANSVIRNRFRGGTDHWNAMYVGNNLAIVMSEPGASLDEVHRRMPGNMHGMSYFMDPMLLYYWRNQTLYLLDEWSAYTNCTWSNVERGQVVQASGQQMAEYTVYAFAAMQAVAETRSSYDAQQMRAAIAWMCERRVMPLLRCRGTERGQQHWQRFVTSNETANLRQFVRDYFGAPWTREVLGF